MKAVFRLIGPTILQDTHHHPRAALTTVARTRAAQTPGAQIHGALTRVALTRAALTPAGTEAAHPGSPRSSIMGHLRCTPCLLAAAVQCWLTPTCSVLVALQGACNPLVVPLTLPICLS